MCVILLDNDPMWQFSEVHWYILRVKLYSAEPAVLACSVLKKKALSFSFFVFLLLLFWPTRHVEEACV